MSTTMKQMREYVFSAYNGKKWHERVLKMPNNQIVAIYKNLKNSEEKRIAYQVEYENGKALLSGDNHLEGPFHQMDIWEYLLTKEVNK